MFSQYGRGQRTGFLLVCIAFVMCLVGSTAPYWITSKIELGSGILNLYSVNIGVWYYCVDILGQKVCHSVDNVGDWMNRVRGLVFFNGLLSFICMCVACCRCVCCSGGRTICHGVTAFLAGGCGCAAFIITFQKTDQLLATTMLNTTYGWSLYIFVIGSIVGVIASVLLCFSAPVMQPVFSGGMIIGNAAPSPGVNVNISNTNTNTNVNQNSNPNYYNNYNMPPPQPNYPPQYPGNTNQPSPQYPGANYNPQNNYKY